MITTRGFFGWPTMASCPVNWLTHWHLQPD